MNGLFNSTVLDVAIGLVFVYLLLAIIASAVNEWFSRLLGMRAKMLEQGIKQLLDAQPTAANPQGSNSFLDLFYKHPLMSGMCHHTNQPSYLPARTFATIVMDLVTIDKQGAITFEDLQNGIKGLPDGDVKKALLAAIQTCSNDLAAAQKAIEAWFDDAMDRVSGWFKRHTQIVILAIAVGLTVVANADTLHIVHQLSVDPALRNAVVDQAKAKSEKGDAAALEPLTDENKQVLGQVVGWQNVQLHKDFNEWFFRIFGWLLTAFAVSLGAPFWFDILNKVMNLRSTGKSPTEKSKSPEKQQQPPADKKA